MNLGVTIPGRKWKEMRSQRWLGTHADPGLYPGTLARSRVCQAKTKSFGIQFKLEKDVLTAGWRTDWGWAELGVEEEMKVLLQPFSEKHVNGR